MNINENAFVSQLPQPSRVPSPDKGLLELSASANNARSAGTMLPPAITRKHALSSRAIPSQTSKPSVTSLTAHAVPEPPSKRRTLVETAGEPLKRTIPAPPSSRIVNPAVKATANAGLGRNQSFSSSVSSRSNSSASRNTSNSSFTASVGSGIRPQSLQNLGRPKSSFAHNRALSKPDLARPATSLGRHEEVQEGPKPKGMSAPMAPFIETLRPSKNRTGASLPYPSLRASVNGSPNRSDRGDGTREPSLSTAMEGLTLKSACGEEPIRELSPSRLPRLATPAPTSPPPRPFLSFSVKPQRSPRKFKQFLTKDSNNEAWDTQERYENLEKLWTDLHAKMDQTVSDTADMKESIKFYKSTSRPPPEIRDALQKLLSSGIHFDRVAQLTYVFLCLVTELEKARAELMEVHTCLRSELETAKYRTTEAERARDAAERDHEIELDDLGRQHRIEIEDCRQEARLHLDKLKNDHREELRDVKRRFDDEVEKERSQRVQALGQLSTQGALDKQRQQLEADAKDQEMRVARAESERLAADLERERVLNADLRQNLSTASSHAVTMESSRQALQAKIDYLESDSKSQSEAYANMERQMREAIDESRELQEKLRKEETLRRKLHNQVQELKGNIRVFCRVRPALSIDDADEQAKISFPDDGEDAKEIEVRGAEEKSSLGTVTTKKHPFAFDRVFGPNSQNQQVFEEISQLIQSALDGFNVCIFCYGQTGSGKTYTMSSEDGMIPRAVHMIYTSAQDLGERGWRYKMEGSFVEVYNENLNDLLGRPDDLDRKKHEIRHDMQACKTTITDITTVELDSPDKVEQILARAMANRSVAATKANERSSRSHSVFILKLSGHNAMTGEVSEGTLNLVDLAGSERLSQSKVEGARLRETQNINRSLSCLGDVIGALGQQQQQQQHQGKDGGGGGHVPYRNSKLTYLLQFSLGGNSKTLMFCMVSPAAAHLGETLTSLRFATKVHNTHIGTAKKQVKG